MIIMQEQKEFIENIIKECSGYKENEALLDEFCDEVIRRADTLLADKNNINDLNGIKIYLKRIANTVITHVTQNATDLTVSSVIENQKFITQNKRQESVSIDYELDENGDIALNYDYDLSFEGEEVVEKLKQKHPTESQIKSIKNNICDLDKKNPSLLYKNIFEMRYSSGLNNQEIAQLLEIKESEVDKNLLFMLNNLKKEVFV